MIGSANEMLDGTLVFHGVEDLDRRPADFLIGIVDQFDDRIHNARPADFGKRVAGAGSYPPVVVFQYLQEVFDRFGVTDLVQHFHRGAARILGFVLERVG